MSCVPGMPGQVPVVPEAQVLSSQFRNGNRLPFGWFFFLQKCEKTALVWDIELNL